jgi:hypothetical protein
MVLTLRPPVRTIPVMAREGYDNVRVRVPVCDRRGVTRFVRSRANQCRARECTDNPPHDVSPSLFFTVRRPGVILIIDPGSTPASGRHGL